MTDQPDAPAPSPTAAAAQRALELKRAAAAAPAGRKRDFADERVAAARSASKSRPALRK
jgi:hypothetical protein